MDSELFFREQLVPSFETKMDLRFLNPSLNLGNFEGIGIRFASACYFLEGNP